MATILANVVMNTPMKRKEVTCEGISILTQEEMQWAARDLTGPITLI